MSVTVTVKLLVPTFAWLSIAVHVTVVVPNGKADPLVGVQLAATTPSKVSTANTVYVNAAPDGPVASTLALAGTVITGAVVSATVTENVFMATFA
jgi:hypothetical protein